jgi:hypothetical protein
VEDYMMHRQGGGREVGYRSIKAKEGSRMKLVPSDPPTLPL